jgi:ATP-binding cassette subfamily F protein 3
MQDFKGGIMVVSHVQYFMLNMCTELWVVNNGKASQFNGLFDEYKGHISGIT